LGTAERLRTIDYLKRKARSTRLQAARAAPVVSEQLKKLAILIEAEAEQLEKSVDTRQSQLEQA
jgi:hypothetical protein